MEGGTISGNTATNNGGGVYLDSGTFTMDGGIIYGNEVPNGDLKNTANQGAAFYKSGGTATINGDTTRATIDTTINLAS
jgi:parallel beta-helix repeat protein